MAARRTAAQQADAAAADTEQQNQGALGGEEQAPAEQREASQTNAEANATGDTAADVAGSQEAAEGYDGVGTVPTVAPQFNPDVAPDDERLYDQPNSVADYTPRGVDPGLPQAAGATRVQEENAQNAEARDAQVAQQEQPASNTEG